MKHKNISAQSSKLLSYFSKEGILSFDNKTAKEALPESGESAVKELLNDMVKKSC